MMTAFRCVICCPLFYIKKGVSTLDNRQKEIASIAEEYAERYGIPREEALGKLNAVTVTLQSLAEAFRPIAKDLVKAWKKIEKLIRAVLYKKSQKQSDNRDKWWIEWDTRKKSLVISNRPRFQVRKVIR